MLRSGVRSALLLVLISLIGTASARATPLLAMGRGQLSVLLGQDGEWQPQAGVPETLTLIAGPPGTPRAARLTAYVALQSAARSCGASPSAAGGPLFAIPQFYSAQDLVTAGSALAPTGGAAAGSYAVAVDAGVLREHGAVRACAWLDRSVRARAPHLSETIPLLNGLVAASVFPTTGGYALDAGTIGTSFGFSAATAVCGSPSPARRVHVGAGQETSDIVSVGSLDCATDGTEFTFYDAAGAAVGALGYTNADALSASAPVAHFGGCDLEGVAGRSLAAARAYVAAVGCHVGRVLTAPADGVLPRGMVSEAQVDGGAAPLAPPGTTVDLVRDG
jgi:hypothetical protein